MHYDSLVIGSGLSGLTCALLLARSGRKVMVLDQHYEPAPVVRGFKRAGIYFDSGFHYAGGLGEGGAFQPLFRHLGLADKLNLFPFEEQGFDCLRIAGGEKNYRLPTGYANIKAELQNCFPEAAPGITAYLDEVEKKWCGFPYLDLDADIADFSIETVHGESLADRLREFSAYPELQSLLSMHSLLYGIDPCEASTNLNTQVAGSYYHSVHGITGGGRALVEALLELLAEAGAEVRCGAEVTEILVENGQSCGVRLGDGEALDGRDIIATLNPTLLPRLLPPGVMRPAYLKRLQKLRQTSSAYILFAQASGGHDLLHRCNLFIQPQAGTFRHGVGQPIWQRGAYLAAADQGRDVTSNGLIGIVPASYDEVAEFSAGTNQRNGNYAQEKKLLAEQLTEIILNACPEFTDLKVLELATPLTLRDYPLAPGGAIYGVGRYIGQYNPHPVTRLPGLYLSGQAVAAPGLLGTVVAAYLTCGSILGHETLRKEVRLCR